MTRVAYFDLASGISGDMILAALVHAGRKLGIDVEASIIRAVESLDLDCAVTFVDDERSGIACLRAEVKMTSERYSASRLRASIEAADLTERALGNAKRTIDSLINAESRVHGTDPEDVHLHELASADTAADIAGAAAGIDALGVTAVHAAPVPVPTGLIETEHGTLPLPGPATLELLAGAQLRGVDSSNELVTPTGAAILIGHNAGFGPLPDMTLEATGVGGGQRRSATPNISRVLIGTGSSGPDLDACVLLETNIDDQSPEALGHALEKLMGAGALDAWVTPIVMKRSRPAFLLSVMASHADESRLTDVMFRETTTLGVRRRDTTRWVLERETITIRIGDQLVRVKIGRLGNEVVNVAPEFSDCDRAAEMLGSSARDVYDEASKRAREAVDVPGHPTTPT